MQEQRIGRQVPVNAHVFGPCRFHQAFFICRGFEIGLASHDVVETVQCSRPQQYARKEAQRAFLNVT